MSYPPDKIMLIAIAVVGECISVSDKFSDLLIIFSPFLPYLYVKVLFHFTKLVLFQEISVPISGRRIFLCV